MFKRQKSDKPRKAPIATHPAFKVIVALWLAALCGLGALVWTSAPLIGLAAALFGGAAGFVAARFIASHSGKQQSNEAPVSETTEKRARTIAPAPVVEEDSSVDEWSEREPEILNIAELGEALPPIAQETIDAAEPVSEPAVEAEIEEPAAHALEADTQPADTLPTEPESAAEVLRSRDIGDMSLVQLIERFALSLDEFRDKHAHNDHEEQPSRPDPALMEALRMLPLLAADIAPQYASDGNAALAISTREQVEATEHALREALAKLEQMSGS